MMTVEDLAKRLRAAGYFVNGIDTMTDEKGAGAALGVSVRTLQNWRTEARGPRCHLTGRWMYELSELINYLERNTPQRRASRYSRDGDDRGELSKT